MTRAAGQRGWADTLALRLFLLTWVALVVSHAAAYAVVHLLAAPPPLQPQAQPSGPGPDAGQGPGPGPGPAPGARPPLPTFPSLPPTPGLGPPHGAPAAPDSMPLRVQLLDYGVRLLVIALAAWWGSRWLAEPVKRVVQAAEALGPALAAGQPAKPLDEHLGTREVQATATVFNRMAQQIQQLFRARGLMIAAISHDLRTPLTRMRLRLETAAIDDTLRQRCVGDLQEMNGLIDGVLEVFRDGEAARPQMQRTDIAALVQALVDDRAELGADVSLAPPPPDAAAPPPTPADPAQLRRVVGNLLDNAQRYAGLATVSMGHDADSVWVDVEDRGPGIPPEQLQDMLQPFSRGESSRNRESGGAGLGLFIASQLMERMGGSLHLSNRPGGGLQARVRLMMARLKG